METIIITTENHSEIKPRETYLKGMRVDYSITYPDGHIMQVKFHKSPSSIITKLDNEIEQIKKQIVFLYEKNQTISTNDKAILKKHYEKEIKKRVDHKEKTLKEIEVTTKIFNPHTE